MNHISTVRLLYCHTYTFAKVYAVAKARLCLPTTQIQFRKSYTYLHTWHTTTSVRFWEYWRRDRVEARVTGGFEPGCADTTPKDPRDPAKQLAIEARFYV